MGDKVETSRGLTDAEWHDLLAAAAGWGMMSRRDNDPRAPDSRHTYAAILQKLRDAGEPVSAITLFGEDFWGAGHERLNAALRRNQLPFRVKFTGPRKDGEERKLMTLILERQ